MADAIAVRVGLDPEPSSGTAADGPLDPRSEVAEVAAELLGVIRARSPDSVFGAMAVSCKNGRGLDACVRVGQAFQPDKSATSGWTA